ncbi:enolase C-terminal domain-like protein [Candidatus Lucifugimonas marina]|jgi:L-alanine-DL-glutamate epimerase-like enolase superfamily enzyme|uniref:Mandelate racemase/muconate lactonizing protein n=1 Tax=Candidatus Lucifugimonas marina TaxID=3038979 RepID=A0AAJ5ZGV3_9CHLR|nr:mandelate racemase/muconate lactonizing protein [SAR202 cluster bacterium JH702]MDG0869374.1 mandelate racemase/muconate lactonizing protein [SAR202 cluster bacterium JH639]WFG36771.1 mandelate racemase/muconate lactonizing protein [SAR202 cluster bacterium JH545]WFG40705.1 mandelate racemase/muconate lactonizing protein [SAR202 cluster bacterium JH1073]
MKIEKVRLRHVFGTIETDGLFWEERLVMPLDVYEEFRDTSKRVKWGDQAEENAMKHDAYFVQIETDEGVIGIGGPMDKAVAFIVEIELSHYLIGRDPLAIEFLWDIMHRASVHGRQGNTMIAISAIDNALWDLKGRYFNVPVYSIIGGPTRDEVPAYASMLGFNVLDMGLVKERAAQKQKEGYTAQKWFFRHGPMSGAEGLKKNVEMVKTLRETLGDDDDIMLDCWQSMDVNYVIKLAEQIEEYHPRWLEETALPDRIDSYRKIREATNIPLSGAEHHYTRWGMKQFIEAEALDIIQPDIYWAGGLSETLKIAALATTFDLITIPHGHSTNAGIHFSVSQSPIHTPYQEYLVKWNIVHQHFLKDPVSPENGMIKAPTGVGMTMDLDPDKIEREEEPNFGS